MSEDNGRLSKADKADGEDDPARTCFVIAPIGSSSTSVRRATEGLVDTVIEPVLKEFDYTVEIAHRLSETGSINKQVITRLVKSDVVVAVLTGLNPNVMYELGVRHAARKPVISMALEGTSLPFDVVQERTIFYENDMQGVREARQDLRDHVETIHKEEIDNPVYRALEFDVMQNKLRDSGEEALATILGMLERILDQGPKYEKESDHKIETSKTTVLPLINP